MNEKKFKSPSFTLFYGVIIAILFILLLIKFFTSFSFLSYEDASDTETSSRISPIGLINLGSGIPNGERTGEEVFNKVCFQCHASDSTTLGSPKITNEKQWAPRIAKGKEALLQSAINGFNNMPSRGGNNTLTDEELERAIVYMANQSGGNFKLSENAKLEE